MSPMLFWWSNFTQYKISVSWPFHTNPFYVLFIQSCAMPFYWISVLREIYNAKLFSSSCVKSAINTSTLCHSLDPQINRSSIDVGGLLLFCNLPLQSHSHHNLKYFIPHYSLFVPKTKHLCTSEVNLLRFYLMADSLLFVWIIQEMCYSV